MKLVTRSQWGARPSRYDLTYIASTQGVKIHYEGSFVPKALADPDAHGSCAGHMRDVQASHLANTKENYSDIAYNAMVCPHGAVFEGRGLHRQTGANGDQALNRKDYAVCAMLGSSGLVIPPDAMLDGLVDAIGWLRTGGSAGKEVLGHRDGYATACPGDPLYAWVKAGAHRPDGTAPHGGTSTPVPSSGGIARYQVVINGLTYGYGARGAHITRVGETLVKRGFGRHYKVGPGPEWTDADTQNYSEFQLSLGYKGTAPHQAADGVPGDVSLHQLLGSLPGKTAVTLPPFPGRPYFLLGAVNDHALTLQTWLGKGNWGPKYKQGPSRTMTQLDLDKVAALQRHYLSALGPADGKTGPVTWQYAYEVAAGQRKK
ncbi:peptidoglycan-binding protein [Streptomyces sp. NPDC088337]|uniref:peptidoglycan-binding protein n=1 Tax=unclassified Streptomyces TaxID=2593676 RepID=UPI00381CB3DB